VVFLCPEPNYGSTGPLPGFVVS